MHHGRHALAAIGIALTLAACGGSGGGAATAAPSDIAAAPTSGASEAAAPGAVASADTSPTEAPASAAGAGDGGTTGVCDLVSAADLAKAFGRDDVTTTLSPGPPDTCAYTGADGTALGAIVLLTAGGQVTFTAVHQGSAITDIPGIGDEAFYSSELQTLIVRKGDTMLTVAVVSADTDDARQQAETTIATAAASRL